MQWAVLSEEGKYLFVLIFLQVRIWFGQENIIGLVYVVYSRVVQCMHVIGRYTCRHLFMGIF